MTNEPVDPIDDQYDEAMELFGGRIPKIGEPTEYLVTDKDMTTRLSEEYAKALIEKYGHTELHSTVDDDTGDFGGLGEFGYEEGPEIVDSPDPAEVPDEELDDDAYYGTYGYSRTAPGCTDPDCPCDED